MGSARWPCGRDTERALFCAVASPGSWAIIDGTGDVRMLDLHQRLSDRVYGFRGRMIYPPSLNSARPFSKVGS
jgi:hypothetical protein